ncbi:MAG: hypothetical protein ACREFT_01045 [Acetobacteraceae bacterium]
MSTDTEHTAPEPELTLRLTLDEVNVALFHLEQGAYCNVAELVRKIREQAEPQAVQHVQRAALAGMPVDTAVPN